MGSMEIVGRADGQRIPVYVAGEATDRTIIVIQEWWGLNDQIKQMADRLAGEGFRAIVPDLYRGQVTTSADEASHLMSHLDWGNAVEDVRAIAALDAEVDRACGITGFCMGGAVTFLAAAAGVPGIKAAVPFYGMPQNLAPLAGIRIPIQAHWATRDYWCSPDAVAKLEAVLLAGNVPYEAHWYEADHAFMNEARPEVYDAGAAEVAWGRMVAFFRQRLA